MIITTKKLFFTDTVIILDDAAAIEAAKKNIDRLTVISHHSLSLDGFRLSEKKTGIIPLDGSADDVLARFRKTTRNEISRTQRESGYRFEVQDVSDETYALYVDFERAIGRTPFKRQHFSACIEFAAYFEDALEAAIWIYPSTPIARIRSIFSARRALEKDASKRVGYETRRLVYEICRWGIATGRTGIDLASVDPDATENRGISDFKLSFEPRIVPEYMYVRSAPLYRFFEKLMGSYRALSSR